jgi:macrolide transport system ATP-binding/permease protein
MGWPGIFSRHKRESDLDREIRAHLDLEAEDQQDAGRTAEDAGYAARRAFGNPALIKEDVRATWGWTSAEAWLQDLRYGLRLLRRNPGFTLFSVASLGLGIGATVAVFSLFDAVVLRRLPVPDAERLVVASFGRPGPNGVRYNYSLPYPQFAQMRESNTTLDGLFAVYPFGRVNVSHGGEPDAAEGLFVTGEYYDVLGLSPELGRLITPDDDRAGQTVAVLSHAYWQRRFGGRSDVLGAAITLNDVPFTIVGVEPRGFFGTEVGRPSDISIPMRTRDRLSEEPRLWNAANATWVYVMGRLKPGVSLERAAAELHAIFRQVSSDGARSTVEARRASEFMFRLESGATGAASDLRDAYAPWLRLLLGVLGAVLLLAGLNVATLLLSRSEARRREIATRLALGAARWRVVRQFVAEAMLLGAIAAAAGLLLSWWGSRMLLRIATSATDRLPLSLAPDARALAFTMAVTVLMCLLFGLIPAWRATSGSRPIHATRQIGGGRRRRMVDRALVACQITISLGLLAVGGLFLRTLGNIWAQETGYDRNNVVMFSVDPRLSGMRGPAVPATYQRLLDELRASPGVQSASVSAVRPVSDGYYFVDVVSKAGVSAFPDGQGIRVAYNVVSPAYFATLGIPLLAGRDFDSRDGETTTRVAIISERMARHFRGNPIGQQITMGTVREVVGVAKDALYANVKDAPRAVVYVPLFQSTAKDMWYSPTFEVRYSGAVAETVRVVRAAVARTNAGLSIFKLKTLQAQTKESLSRERLLAMITAYVGGFALLLTCIGLFGLMSYGVTQRTPEMGLRMALGARPSAVRWLIVREGTATVLAGVGAGLVLALAAADLVRSQLFGVEPYDPPTLIGATVLLLIVAFAAAYVPAARASRIDPTTALRHE